MKNRVKRFGEFLNENHEERMGIDNEMIGLAELVDCYIEQNYPEDLVLVAVKSSDTVEELRAGGISIVVDPSEEIIDEIMNDSGITSQIYDSGKPQF
jgi:hypothetical protein